MNDNDNENAPLDQTDGLPPVLNWSHELAHLPRKRADEDIEVSRIAEPDELAAIGRTLRIISCGALQASYAISARAKGRFIMQGTLRAQVTQSCVVTLDPVHELVEEEFVVEFWPHDQLLTAPGEEIELGPDDLEKRENEPIIGDELEAGRVIYEVLAAGLNLYPRAQDAVFDPEKIGVAEQVERENPFAALEQLKGKR